MSERRGAARAIAGGPVDIEALAAQIRACRICRDTPLGQPLPHEPRPVLRASASARIAVFSQAPGVRVHASGIPFTDPSGVRLRAWMGVTDAEFYDTARVAIVPMGFCFPGHDAKRGDLPPRRECAPAWRVPLLAAMPRLELILLVGQYAQRWHLPADQSAGGLTATVARWREIAATSPVAGVAATPPVHVPLPHPSWRNSGWLIRNPWFEAELLPWLRNRIRGQIQADPDQLPNMTT